MHMADALITPAVGGGFWAISAALIGYCSSKLRNILSEPIVPLMGVMGAFIFAAQMINFSIPLTGSSGHIGGGLLLAILLGPQAGFIVIASVLVVQAMFFADGGILALGCNIFNMGFFPCFIAYPLVYKKIAAPAADGAAIKTQRLWLGSIIASIVGLQLGAFAVVIQTAFSGISDLPFSKFILFMQPIHLGIGFVEGAVTAVVASWVLKARPEILSEKFSAVKAEKESLSIKPVLASLALAALAIGCVVSWFACGDPDGLEWAIGKTAQVEELEAPQEGLHASANQLQAKTSFLPDYGFATGDEETEIAEAEENSSVVNAGTSVSGLVGGCLTLVIAAGAGAILRKKLPRRLRRRLNLIKL